MTRPADDAPLAEARTWLRERLDEGARCPCCTQHAQVYRWSLYGTAARALILYWRLGRGERYVHSSRLKDLGHKGQGDATRLRLWKLLAEEPDRRPDGGKSGWWLVTDLGREFIYRRATIPKYVYTFASRRIRYDDDHAPGPQVGIEAALGKRFDYRELMEGL